MFMGQAWKAVTKHLFHDANSRRGGVLMHSKVSSTSRRKETKLIVRSWSLSMRNRIIPLVLNPARNVKPTTALRGLGDGHTWVPTILLLPLG
jgi:hypothetical protein